MKKEYLILILIIAALAGYLALNKENRNHYTLPDPPTVDTEEINRLTVKKTEQTLDFIRTESGWVVTTQSYPADSTAVRQMLDVISGLTLSALVSEKQDVIRYELDDAHRLAVTAFKGETPVLSFKIGKTAPTFNHTYVMLENDPNIYQANDSFRSHFNKSLDEFRDRRVLTFQEDHIKAITIKTPEKEVVLTAREPADDDTRDPEPVFSYTDGTSPDPKTLLDLLNSLSDLTCERFLPDMDAAGMESSSPILIILLENDSTKVLKLFEQNGDEPVPATSSMNDQVFLLESYVAEDIISYAHDLAGLTPEETKDPASP
ncbi:MAG: DUF4340 domain-containing protein [Desulfotignum sp.]